MDLTGLLFIGNVTNFSVTASRTIITGSFTIIGNDLGIFALLLYFPIEPKGKDFRPSIFSNLTDPDVIVNAISFPIVP